MKFTGSFLLLMWVGLSAGNAQNAGAAFAGFVPQKTTVITTAQVNTAMLWWGDFSQSEGFLPLREQFEGILADVKKLEPAMLDAYALPSDPKQRRLFVSEFATATLIPEYALHNPLVANGKWYVRINAQTVSGVKIPFVIKVKQEKGQNQLSPFDAQERDNALYVLLARLDGVSFRALTALHPEYQVDIRKQFEGCRIPAKNNIVDMVCLAEIVSSLSPEELALLTKALYRTD